MIYNVLSVVSFIGVSYLCIDKYIKYRDDYKKRQLYKDTYKKMVSDDGEEFDIEDLYENALISKEQYEDYKRQRPVIKPRRGSITTMTRINPILRDGELVIVYGNDGKVYIKVGNGKDCFTDLPYLSTPTK